MYDDVECMFVGPQDKESCDWCDEAVDGNPYTLADVPQPGDGDCMARCRHAIQLSDSAPPEIPTITWTAHIGFGGEVPGQLIDLNTVDSSNLSEPYAVEGVPGFNQADAMFQGAIGVARFTFDDLLGSFKDIDPTDSDAMAKLLFDARLTPDDVSGMMGLDLTKKAQKSYDVLLSSMLGDKESTRLNGTFARLYICTGTLAHPISGEEP